MISFSDLWYERVVGLRDLGGVLARSAKSAYYSHRAEILDVDCIVSYCLSVSEYFHEKGLKRDLMIFVYVFKLTTKDKN
jgi:hypothetical protein